MKQYLVIGLGRFGTSVAKTLYEAGENILGIDVSEELVQDRINNNILKNAIIGDASDGKILKDIGAENFDVAFVCIGDIEASVMIALNLKELGIKSIIAKAINKKPVSYTHLDVYKRQGVGGGIACESELEFEYEETLQKAKAILEAIC